MLETEEYIPIPTYSQEVHLRYYLDFKAGRLFLEEVLHTLIQLGKPLQLH